MNPKREPRDSDRRRLCGWIAAASGLAAVGMHAGCSGPAPGDPDVAVALADLADGRRTIVRWRDQPVEVVRAGDEIRARSLICTHMSCTVRWEADRGRYVCPCHHGEFDADGVPVAGPPERPLRIVPVTVEDGTAWVGRG